MINHPEFAGSTHQTLLDGIPFFKFLWSCMYYDLQEFKLGLQGEDLQEYELRVDTTRLTEEQTRRVIRIALWAGVDEFSEVV